MSTVENEARPLGAAEVLHAFFTMNRSALTGRGVEISTAIFAVGGQMTVCAMACSPDETELMAVRLFHNEGANMGVWAADRWLPEDGDGMPGYRDALSVKFWDGEHLHCGMIPYLPGHPDTFERIVWEREPWASRLRLEWSKMLDRVSSLSGREMHPACRRETAIDQRAPAAPDWEQPEPAKPPVVGAAPNDGCES